MIHISLAAETLFHIAGMPVTNTLLVSVAITLFLSALAFFVSGRLKWRPSQLQNTVELVCEHLLGFLDTITENRRASERYMPLVATIFLFVLLSNLVEIVPGLGTIGLVEYNHGDRMIVPFLRSSSADLNVTIAIAVSAIIGVQIFGIVALGFFRYARKFFYPPWEAPYVVGTFIGILELFAEIAKVVSFSFRLFGNIFAGEVLLTVMLFLLPIGAPLPFLLLEVFVGFIQAIVFAMLTLVFIKVATEHH